MSVKSGQTGRHDHSNQSPEVEVLINQRFLCGALKDAADVILRALRSFTSKRTTAEGEAAQPRKSLRDVFEAVSVVLVGPVVVGHRRSLRRSVRFASRANAKFDAG